MSDTHAMHAGRELDALVAERVMGWRYSKSKRGTWLVHLPEGDTLEPTFGWPQFDAHTGEPLVYPWWEGTDVPPYSVNMAAAWEVVEKLADAERGWWRFDQFGWGWHAYWYAPGSRADFPRVLADATGETLPLAICRAALAAPEPTP